MIEDIKTLREEHVYRAKLAEQAERYDGRSLFLCIHTGIGNILHRLYHYFIRLSRLVSTGWGEVPLQSRLPGMAG